MIMVLPPKYFLSWLYGSIFIVALCTLGKISSEVLIADVLAVGLIVPVLLLFRAFLNRRQVLIAVSLFTFGVASSVVHIVLNLEPPFYSAVIMARSFSAFVVFFFFYGMSKRTKIHFRAGFLVVFVVAVTGSVLGLARGERSYYGYAKVGMNISPGNAGFILASIFIGVLSALFIFQSNTLDKRSAVSRLSLVVIAAVLLLLVVLTSSKSSTAGAVGAGMLLIFLQQAERRMGRTSAILLAVFLSLVVLVVAYALVTKTGVLFDSLNRFNHVDSAIKDRFFKLIYYFRNMNHEASNPVIFILLGMGPGAAASFSYVPGTSFFSFDSMIGRMIWEWGPIGTILWFMFFGSVLRQTMANSSRSGFAVVAFYLFGMIFGIGVEFLWIAPSGYLFMVFLGVIAGHAEREAQPKMLIKT